MNHTREIFIYLTILICVSSYKVLAADKSIIFNPVLVEAAENGNIMAMIRIGFHATYSGESTQDRLIAQKWLKKADSLGCMQATNILHDLAQKWHDDVSQLKYATGDKLAKCYLYGIGIHPDPAKSLSQFDKNENLKMPFEDIELARILCKYGCSVVDTQLTNMLKRRVEAQDAEAMYDLACIESSDSANFYNRILGSYQKGYKYASLMLFYKIKTVQLGSIESQFYPGFDPNKDMELIKSILTDIESYLDSGDVHAAKLMRNYDYNINNPILQFSDGTKHFQRRSKKAFSVLHNWYPEHYSVDWNNASKSQVFNDIKRQATEGDGYAAWELGRHYYGESSHWGIKPDVVEALHWFEKSIEFGCSPAYYDLGYLYENDETYKDHKKSYLYYLKSANSPALVEINPYGDYEFGYYSPESKLICNIEENNLRAAAKTAFYLEQGINGTPDFEQAFQYYFVSALNPFVNGRIWQAALNPIPIMCKIAECYDYGKGVEESSGKALWWYIQILKSEKYAKSKGRWLPQPLDEAVKERYKSLKNDGVEPIEEFLYKKR